MSHGTAFKIGNPGCACCGLCACYPFDGNGHDAISSKNLTATEESYAPGVMDKAASFTGSSHYSHAHDDCFSPAASDDVWRMWFWIKSVTDPPHSPTFGYQGVITKGNLNYVYGSPPSISFDGEWGVFYRDGGVSGPDLLFVYKSDVIANGIFGATGLIEGHQYFFHWQINNTTKAAALTAWNATTNVPVPIPSGLSGSSPPSTSITGTMSVDESMPLRIGQNGGAAGQILANNGLILIDNVGFSHHPGLADNLYNLGAGKRCPYAG